MASSDERPIAFISGAAGGIGTDAANMLAQRGYRLWLTGRNEATLGALASQFENPLFSLSDLADPDQLEALCMEIESSPAPIAVGLVNAGIVTPGSYLSLSRQQIDSQLDVNLRAAMHLSHALAKRMLAAGSGHLINVVSQAAFVSLKDSVTYSATKFGQRGFILGLAEELHDKGVKVSGIYPGAIDTPMLETEARSGGSLLNFMSPPHPTAIVVDAIAKALDEGKEHYIVPKSDTLLLQVMNAFPSMLRKRYPKWEDAGRKGREAYLRKIAARGH